MLTSFHKRVDTSAPINTQAIALSSRPVCFKGKEKVGFLFLVSNNPAHPDTLLAIFLISGVTLTFGTVFFATAMTGVEGGGINFFFTDLTA